MYFFLKKPNLSKINKTKCLNFLSSKPKSAIINFYNKTSFEQYLYWDQFKYKEPSPKGISKEELWFITNFIRETKLTPTIIKHEDGQYFRWAKLKKLEKFCHTIDLNANENLFNFYTETDKNEKQKLISRGVIEEAIASSQLEGAVSSRKVAKQFLREGKKPQNNSEKMIFNNYLSMKAIEENYKKKELSITLILEMHGLITKDLFDSNNEKPRLRKKNEDIFVSDSSIGIIYHKGPKPTFVQKELIELINFANDKSKNNFIHPIVKAIMLHFWIGYLHPFTDGNGRLARLLFYWYLLKHNYEAFAYLPISKIIGKSPDQYKMAYVYSEQDNYNLTYFIDYNIKKIELAIVDFQKYYENKVKDNVQINNAAIRKYLLNERQIQLLKYLYKNNNAKISLQTHINTQQITNKTAIKDLKDLESKKLIFSQKIGRNIYYYATNKIKSLFQNN